MVELPAPVLVEVDALVESGVYASREEAIADLVRLGLAALRTRAPRPYPRPPTPPGRREPSDDRPIESDPARDVNWV